MKRWATLAVLAVLLAVSGAPAGAADVFRHTGTLTSFDRATGTLVVAEVGPWRVRDGVTVVTERTVTLTPATRFSFVRRGEPGETAWPGDFLELAIDAWEMLPGDFVTVECRHEADRMIALRVQVLDVP